MTIELQSVDLVISGTAIVLVVSAALWGGVKYLTRKNVDRIFNQKMENHKHELQTILEFNKFDLQRKMHDFNLFNTKKHEVYPKLYELILMAEGKLFSLQGFRQVPDYIRMNVEELERSLKLNYGFDDVDLKWILENWESDKENVFEELKKLLRRVEIGNARSAVYDAQNFYLLSRLYLTEEIFISQNKLFEKMLHYVIDIEHLGNADTADRIAMRKSIDENKELIKQLVKKSGELLKGELQKGSNFELL